MKIQLIGILFLFVSCSKTTPINNETIVAIQPYQGFPKNKIDTLSKTIAAFYKLKVVVLPENNLPKTAFVNIKSPRFRADSIIRIQNSNRLHNYDFTVGLTESDISVTKVNPDGSAKEPKWKYNDFGVMGLAYCPGKAP